VTTRRELMNDRSRFTLMCRAVGIVMALTAARPATAQRVPPLLGSRVRIEADSQRLSGVVIRQSTDSLTLRADGDSLVYPLAVADLWHLDKHVRRRSARSALAGFAIGGVLGFVSGAIDAHYSFVQCERRPGENDLCGLAGIAIPVYTFGGAVIGTVVGGLVKHSRWESVF
jgi:hypothetical protein